MCVLCVCVLCVCCVCVCCVCVVCVCVVCVCVVDGLQGKLRAREERLKNITANIRKREEARKEPGNHVMIM